MVQTFYIRYITVTITSRATKSFAPLRTCQILFRVFSTSASLTRPSSDKPPFPKTFSRLLFPLQKGTSNKKELAIIEQYDMHNAILYPLLEDDKWRSHNIPFIGYVPCLRYTPCISYIPCIMCI